MHHRPSCLQHNDQQELAATTMKILLLRRIASIGRAQYELLELPNNGDSSRLGSIKNNSFRLRISHRITRLNSKTI
jgi:hypothetical protein